MSAAANHRQVTGRLELLRARVYRFCDSDEAYALVEAIVRKHSQDEELTLPTLAMIDGFLRAWRTGPAPVLPVRELADEEGVDVAAELDARRRWMTPSHEPPTTATFIVGAPRSGTTYLYNLLAYQGVFAYPTSISCHRWPTWNLVHDPRSLLTYEQPATLQSDTKLLRLRGDLALPSEYEGMFQRALPAYAHNGAHDYSLKECTTVHAELLHRDIRAHLAYFDSDHFLSKSPFHTFRMFALEASVGAACRFIHIHRDGDRVAASIAENGFRYRFGSGRPLGPDESWAAFVETALAYPRNDLVYSVRYESLRAEPRRHIENIMIWLGILHEPRVPGGTSFRRGRR